MVDFISHFLPHRVCRPTEKIQRSHQWNIDKFADDFLEWYQSKSMGFFVFLKAFAGYNFDLLELESVSGLQNYVIKKCFSNLIPNQLPKINKGLFKVTKQKCYFKSAHVDITCKAHVFVHVWIVLGLKKNDSFTRAIFSIRKVFIYSLQCSFLTFLNLMASPSTNCSAVFPVGTMDSKGFPGRSLAYLSSHSGGM